MRKLKNKFKSKTWDSQGDAVGSYIDETILPELKEMWSKLINREENSKTSNGGDEKETMKNEFDKNVAGLANQNLAPKTKFKKKYPPQMRRMGD